MNDPKKILTKEELREALKAQYGNVSDIMLNREYQSYADRLKKNYDIDVKDYK